MDLTINDFLTTNQITQLISFSNNDPEVLKFTHDSTRFKDLESFNNWLQGDIKIYVLTSKDEDLLGIIWIKEKLNKFSKFGHTFAIRIYNPIRGKGYSYEFVKSVFTKLKIKGIWLSTHKDNLAALHLYEKLNFKQVGVDGNQVIMELDISK